MPPEMVYPRRCSGCHVFWFQAFTLRRALGPFPVANCYEQSCRDGPHTGARVTTASASPGWTPASGAAQPRGTCGAPVTGTVPGPHHPEVLAAVAALQSSCSRGCAAGASASDLNRVPWRRVTRELRPRVLLPSACPVARPLVPGF